MVASQQMTFRVFTAFNWLTLTMSEVSSSEHHHPLSHSQTHPLAYIISNHFFFSSFHRSAHGALVSKHEPREDNMSISQTHTDDPADSWHVQWKRLISAVARQINVVYANQGVFSGFIIDSIEALTTVFQQNQKFPANVHAPLPPKRAFVTRSRPRSEVCNSNSKNAVQTKSIDDVRCCYRTWFYLITSFSVFRTMDSLLATVSRWTLHI